MPAMLPFLKHNVKHALMPVLLPGLLLPGALSAQTTPPAPVPAVATPAHAADKAPPANKNQIPMQTLEKVIAETLLTRPVIVLAVGVKNMTAANSDNRSIERAIVAFNMAQQQFGWVLAIGPPQITHLETNFGEPNPFRDMPPNEAMPLLMASLTDAQRSKLSSRDGLGLSDLSDPMQKNIFRALMPREGANGFVQQTSGSAGKPFYVHDVNAKAQGAKLHLGQEVQLLTQTDQGYSMFAPQSNGPNNKPLYELSSGNAYRGLEMLNGIPVHFETPNRLKRSELDYNTAALQVPIAPDGVKTVGDLMARIAKETGMEIYADAHYERRSLALRIGRQSANAADFLRALAFCVTGTYRKVGTAYILTDDLVGVGTRKQLIQNFELETSALRYKSLKAAEKSLQENPDVQKMKLDWLNDDVAITPEQEKNGSKPEHNGQMNSSFTLPLDQLNAAQQKVLQDLVKLNEGYKKQYPGSNFPLPDLTKNITVLKQPVVTLNLPGIDGVVRLDIGPQLAVSMLKPDKSRNFNADDFKKMLLGAGGDKLWKEGSVKYVRRGLVARPHSRDDVDRALLRIKEFGLNELWMVVFNDGKAIIPNTPFPILPALKDTPDLLTYAIEAARAQNVKVCPVMELLAWGSDTPGELRDWDILGEDLEQAERRLHQIRVLRTKPGSRVPDAPKRTVYVNPFEETVQKKLHGLMKAVAAYPGLGDWVWESAVSEGYSKHRSYYRAGNLTFGYNVTARLAMLRKYHIDPIDLKQPVTYSEESRANLEIPAYGGDENDDTYATQWSEVREEALRHVLYTLYLDSIATLPEDRKPNVFIMEGFKLQYEFWYEPWNPHMKEATPLSDDMSYTPAQPVATPGPDSIREKALPPPTGGIFHFFLPNRIGPMDIDRKDWMPLLGMQISQLSNMRGGNWAGIVLEEQNVDIDFDQ